LSFGNPNIFILSKQTTFSMMLANFEIDEIIILKAFQTTNIFQESTSLIWVGVTIF